MSFLSRLFRSKSPTGSAEHIDSELARLEADAGTARPGYVGSAYNRAGDLALKAERPDQAVSYYGRGIDAFLDEGQRELARGVANKIIRVRPTAVRTLCTLTWLDLAARHQATALHHLRDYSAAAKEASQGDRAATQMYAMARVSPDSQFVDAVADALDGLDFVNRAKEVRGWATAGAPDAIADGEALSEACVAAALGSNDPDTPMLTDEMEVPEADAFELAAEDPSLDGAEDSEAESTATEKSVGEDVHPERLEVELDATSFAVSEVGSGASGVSEEGSAEEPAAEEAAAGEAPAEEAAAEEPPAEEPAAEEPASGDADREEASPDQATADEVATAESDAGPADDASAAKPGKKRRKSKKSRRKKKRR
jgi:hypothetical protein